MNMFKKVFSFSSTDQSDKESNDQPAKKIKDPSFNIDSNFAQSIVLPLGYTVTKEKAFTRGIYFLTETSELDVSKMYSIFQELVKKYPRIKHEDEFRYECCTKKGGIDFNNKEITSLIRSSATYLIGQIGRKVLSGDFNLTTISFPIRVMIPLTILQSIARSLFQFPYYCELAKDLDVIEKMKFAIVAYLSSFYCSTFCLKPMNPVLGETYEACFSDGTKIFMEQTSHHPPITHYELIGPNNNFYFTGFSNFKSSAGLNHLMVFNNGKRTLAFKDGTKIKFNHCKECYNNTLFGTINLESQGEIVFTEEKSGLYCKIKLGAIKGKPSDCISGEILQNDKVVSTISGSFLSHIDFDGVRYWDIRDNFPISLIDYEKNLPSSCVYREDRVLLEQNKVEDAQVAKEKIENIQRGDRKLREKAKK
mmetsp:Transcript_34336/g.35628  ORF Transcript_34336/g.35628 Transcript_34336/m.35628 type:complete len:421 (+) Transcript_34336:44-1306(+)